MPIPEIKITGTQISEIKIPDVMQQLPQVPTAIPVYPPVTSTVGVPIINIPGCVEAHEQNSSKEKSGVLAEDDPKGVVTYCDAGIPSFNPIDYNKDKLKFEYEAPIPKVRPPKTPDVETPEVPKNAVPKDKYECPGPNAPRIGDVAQNQKERVSGYETRIINNEQVCVTLYEDIPLTSQYLPAPQVVATTAAIAAVATTSALLAKPLADLLLKIVKPAVKKGIAAAKKKILGKEPPRLNVRDRRDEQRQRSHALRTFRKMMGRK